MKKHLNKFNRKDKSARRDNHFIKYWTAKQLEDNERVKVGKRVANNELFLC